MEVLCPLCNGLKEYNIVCETCDRGMENQGPLVDYLDDYSPYLSNDITQLVDGAPHDECVHIFKCNICETDKRVNIKRVRM